MMRALKIFSVVLLVLAAALFAAAEAQAYLGRDDTLPEITAESDTLEVPCDYTEEQLLEGVSASDERDGDLTDQVLVGEFSRFIEPGVCDLSYVVFDASEHMATLTRRVRFTDYHAPRFALSAPLCFEEGTTNNTAVRALFTAGDMLDGDLTDWITYVETDAVYSTPGDYTITMEVRNSFGDTASYAFPIHIYEQNAQALDIALTAPIVYVQQGASFNPKAYVEEITDASGSAYDLKLLKADSNVDTAVPGLYEVHYEVQAADGDSTAQDGGLYGEIWLTVIVQEVPA